MMQSAHGHSRQFRKVLDAVNLGQCEPLVEEEDQP